MVVAWSGFEPHGTGAAPIVDAAEASFTWFSSLVAQNCHVSSTSSLYDLYLLFVTTRIYQEQITSSLVGCFGKRKVFLLLRATLLLGFCLSGDFHKV